MGFIGVSTSSALPLSVRGGTSLAVCYRATSGKGCAGRRVCFLPSIFSSGGGRGLLKVSWFCSLAFNKERAHILPPCFVVDEIRVDKA